MRILKVTLAILVLGMLVLSWVGCSSASEEAELLENEIITVQRGDLAIEITAVGNLALSHTEDLDFDIFYAEATVAEVLVEEGDTVTQGQLLATLDTSEWEDELSILEDNVTAAERELTAKERDLIQKQINLINAEIDLEEAEDTWLESESAGNKVLRLEQRLEWYLENDPGETEKINDIKEELEWRWNEFFRVASDSDEVTIKEMELELAQAQLEDAQTAIEDAQKALADAREELDEANNQSPEIRATFDGFVTMVNVEGGDEVLTGTVAVQIADPEKFEAEVMVSEMDISQIKLGGEATVQPDALPDLILSAEVTHIWPTATISSGVVNYKVKVEVASLQALMQEQIEAMQKIMDEAAAGIMPEHLKQAIEEGQITQEQAEEMSQQGQKRLDEQLEQMPAMVSEDFQLREGLTVTINLLVDERTDVLLVPNGAVYTEGRQAYVQVVAPDGTIEERTIQTGISDWQYTEVTDGLSESEQVVVPQGMAVTTPSTENTRPPGGGFVPRGVPGGMGVHP